jgi:hypothetical protein
MTYKEECIPLENQDDWNKCLEGIQHTFFHTWEHSYAIYLTHHLPTYLYYLETGNNKVAIPFTERKFREHIDIFSPHGFAGLISNNDPGICIEQWNNFARSRNYVCGYIGLNPIYDKPHYLANSNPIHYNNVYVLDLTLSEEDLFNNLHTNRRRQIRAWEKSNKTFIEDKEALIPFFLEHYHEFMASRQASSVTNFSMETLRYLLNLDNIIMVGAGSNNKVEVVAVFGFTSHICDYLFNVSLPEGQEYSVSLLWYAIKQAKSKLIPTFEFGGGKQKEDSLAQFKERFGSKKIPLRCLKQVYNNELYNKLCIEVNADPHNLLGYFPAYRKS